ncbi:hypothetical protein [Actinoplanes regularis]|uniref:Uncharacterized protein n=1 Tax=Actinoplanes regularis TaxID=52697 RepID=A0A239FS47_9ACTN|nr:hypothetical protein [Actinoplanes regularis]GIE90185.1 hypothetical protein Are01nite_66650 [Actinoplanes regularis]SNS59052.1 hypothetical protein SAMN06264365_1193 [Actinoplanes regularis]
MYSCCLALLAVAGVALHPAPVRYDPETKTGYVAGGEIRKAFGWSAAVLASKAAGIRFDHQFWTDDTYTATCGREVRPVVHHREFGRYDLSDEIARTGQGDLDFRITGAPTGISGTTSPPQPGDPCPDRPDATITRIRLASTTTGWSLNATSGAVHRRLLTRHTTEPGNSPARPGQQRESRTSSPIAGI